MKTFSDLRSLILLKKWDDYLLTHSPVVWRTKALFVLFYGLVGAILLFAAGYFYPLDAQHLSVDPIKPIEIGYDNYHLTAVFFLSFGLLFWAYSQYQLGFPFTKIKHALLTLGLYASCFWVVFGITAPAFRIGTILRTSNWINQQDMDTLEINGIYPYGFVLLNVDHPDHTTSTDSFFYFRENIFKSIYQVENFLLQNNYNVDTIFWENWFNIHKLSHQSNLWDLSDLSYQSNGAIESSGYGNEMSERWDTTSERYQSYSSYQSYLSDLSNRSYQSYYSYLFYLSNYSSQFPPNLSDEISRMHSTSYRSYRLYRPELLNFSKNIYALLHVHFLDTFSLLSEYRGYYQPYNQQKKLLDLNKEFDKYRFADTIESLKIVPIKSGGDSTFFKRPALPYSIENAVKSVEHAKLYLKEKVYFRYLSLVLNYIFLLSLLLYFIRFLTFRYLLILLIILATFTLTAVANTPILNLQSLESVSLFVSKKSNNINILAYLCLPLLSCIFLFWSILVNRNIKVVLFAANSLFISLLSVLFGALFIIYRIKLNFYEIEIFQPPHQIAFYGIQIISLIAALLITHLLSLPKTN